ncbi:MAG: hypothetical protein JHD32_00805 [Sphingobium sp.]|nr:hypothetical protein [Sphingobium sp.]
MAEPTSFHPAAPFVIGLVTAVLWIILFPALAWLLPMADALIDWIFH